VRDVSRFGRQFGGRHVLLPILPSRFSQNRRSRHSRRRPEYLFAADGRGNPSHRYTRRPQHGLLGLIFVLFACKSKNKHPLLVGKDSLGRRMLPGPSAPLALSRFRWSADIWRTLVSRPLAVRPSSGRHWRRSDETNYREQMINKQKRIL
jgi:hypothetical protein